MSLQDLFTQSLSDLFITVVSRRKRKRRRTALTFHNWFTCAHEMSYLWIEIEPKEALEVISLPLHTVNKCIYPTPTPTTQHEERL